VIRRPEVDLTLYLRRVRPLTNPDPKRVKLVEGDVLDREKLEKAMRGQNMVYANLAGSRQSVGKKANDPGRNRRAASVDVRASRERSFVLRPGARRR